MSVRLRYSKHRDGLLQSKIAHDKHVNVLRQKRENPTEQTLNIISMYRYKRCALDNLPRWRHAAFEA